MKKSLMLEGLEIYVSLGCSIEERAYKQKIKLNIELVFDSNFKACDIDDLNETICYYTLRNHIQSFCDDKEFNLIEYLSKQIYDFIANEYPQTSIEYLKLIKRPPASQIASASFIIRK
jgi:dihydroneopterin aldolase